MISFVKKIPTPVWYKMKQNIEIDVDEKGTHVESITSTSFATLSKVSKPTKADFYANRPFIERNGGRHLHALFTISDLF